MTELPGWQDKNELLLSCKCFFFLEENISRHMFDDTVMGLAISCQVDVCALMSCFGFHTAKKNMISQEGGTS